MSENNLTFLVHLSDKLTTGRYKFLINAHISKQAHIQRKKRARQASLDFQRVPASSLAYLTSEPSAPTTSNPLELVIQDAVGRSTSPLSYVDNGSLDPFDMLGVKIDPKAVRYLSFGRTILEEAIHNVDWRGWGGPTVHRKPYVGPDLLAGQGIALSDGGTAQQAWLKVTIYGILAYCASGIATISSDAASKQDELRYAMEGMKNMREYLDDVNHDLNTISEDLIYRLFRAEVLANNHSSALIHGQLLKMILMHRAKTSGLKLGVLSNALYQNGQFMFNSWTRSIFESRWVAEQYQLVWSTAQDIFEGQISFDDRHLNPSITGDDLRYMFLSTKTLILQTLLGLAQSQEVSLYQRYTLATRCEWLQITLMDYYLDHEASRPDVSEDATFTQEVNLCLVLATMYVLRHSKNDVFIQGRPLFLGSSQIFRKLHGRLCGILHSEVEADVNSYAAAMTFILYVVALASAYVQGISGEEVEARLCYQMLKQHLSDQGINSWTDLLCLLESFAFIEQELPQPYPGWCDSLFPPG